MTLLWIVPGLLLPTLSGWALVRLIEDEFPVLFRTERWVIGGALGLLLSQYGTFLLHIAGVVDFTLVGFIVPQCLLGGVLGFLWFRRRRHLQGHAQQPPSAASPLPTWGRVTVGILAVWMLVKIIAMSGLLTLSPPYFDDVLNTWNLRGKILFFTQQLSLSVETGGATGTASYPPAVPMLKAWLSTLAGGWHEALVNLPHLLWFLATAAILYFLLRRSLPAIWSFLGTYVLLSLPLYLIHGSAAYADVFLSLHILLSVGMLFCAARETQSGRRQSYLRLSALSTALLIFTKNEALLLYLPPILLLLAILLWHWNVSGRMDAATRIRTIVIWAFLLALVLVPWLGYKWMNGLTFGNAKPLTGLGLTFEPLVFVAVFINTFFEGNWALLPVLLVGLLIARRSTAFRTPLAVLTAFFLIVFFGQLPIYVFTPLSTEALTQTGYARGLIHIAPIAVMIMTILLEDLVSARTRRDG